MDFARAYSRPAKPPPRPNRSSGSTPDHSSLSVIRGSLGTAIYQAAFELVLQGLRQHGLLKGRNLGIDSGVIVAAEVLARVCEDAKQTKVLSSPTADEGCFAVEEVCCLQGERVRVVIGDPHESKRKPDK